MKTRMNQSKFTHRIRFAWPSAVALSLSAADLAQTSANTIEPGTTGMKK